jgi:hypothetical protein
MVVENVNDKTEAASPKGPEDAPDALRSAAPARRVSRNPRGGPPMLPIDRRQRLRPDRDAAIIRTGELMEDG